MDGPFPGGAQGDPRCAIDLLTGLDLTPAVDRTYPLAGAAGALRSPARSAGKIVVTSR
jgi:hypothetical protein